MEQNQSQPRHLHPKIWVPALVAVTVVAGFLLWAKESQEWPFAEGNDQRTANSDKKKVDDISSWKTYRSDKYGFEVKYPGDWILEEAKPNYNVNGVFITAPNDDEGSGTITISKSENSKTSLVDQTLDIVSEVTKVYSGKQWKIIISREKQEPTVEFYDATVIFGQYSYLVGARNFGDSVRVINQILSTFKFIESAETSNWKTYRNEEYGFEFKLPPGWRQFGNKIESKISPKYATINFASPESQAGPQFKSYGGELDINIWENPYSLSIKDFFLSKNVWGPDFLNDATGGFKSITVDNRAGLRLFDVVGESTSQIAIISNRDKFIEIIDSSYFGRGILDRILSTFKFTK